jgi:hypothetical protein
MGNAKTCKDCTKRTVGCHSHCEIYKAFRTELDKRNELIRKNKEAYYKYRMRFT